MTVALAPVALALFHGRAGSDITIAMILTGKIYHSQKPRQGGTATLTGGQRQGAAAASRFPLQPCRDAQRIVHTVRSVPVGGARRALHPTPDAAASCGVDPSLPSFPLIAALPAARHALADVGAWQGAHGLQGHRHAPAGRGARHLRRGAPTTARPAAEPALALMLARMLALSRRAPPGRGGPARPPPRY